MQELRHHAIVVVDLVAELEGQRAILGGAVLVDAEELEVVGLAVAGVERAMDRQPLEQVGLGVRLLRRDADGGEGEEEQETVARGRMGK